MTHLTKGSRYRIVSASSAEDTIVSEGVLQGFLTMGEEPALLLDIGEKGKEKLRILPVSTILYIDVLEYKDEKDQEQKGDVNYIS